MMNVTRRSPWTGELNTMTLDISEGSYLAWDSGMLIQQAMPNLTSTEREFIKTGLTASDWMAMFDDELEEDL